MWSWKEFVRLAPPFQKKVLFSEDNDGPFIDLLEEGTIRVIDFEVVEEEGIVYFQGLLFQEEQESPVPIRGWICPPPDNVGGWSTYDETQFDFWVDE